MKKNQIFIKCGTEYKEMTKELLEACNLAGEIEKKFEKCGLKVLSENSGAGLQQNSEKIITEAKFETKSSLIDNSEAEVDCFYSSDSVEKQNSEFGLYNMRIGIKPNLVAPMEAYWGGTTHPEVVAGIVEYLQEKGFFQSGDHGRFLGRKIRPPNPTKSVVSSPSVKNITFRSLTCKRKRECLYNVAI